MATFSVIFFFFACSRGKLTAEIQHTEFVYFSIVLHWQKYYTSSNSPYRRKRLPVTTAWTDTEKPCRRLGLLRLTHVDGAQRTKLPLLQKHIHKNQALVVNRKDAQRTDWSYQGRSRNHVMPQTFLIKFFFSKSGTKGFLTRDLLKVWHSFNQEKTFQTL